MPAGRIHVHRRRAGLAVKLAVAVVSSFTALLALFSYLSLREHRRHSEELVLQSADRISDLIQRSTNYQMLHNDREALYAVISSIGKEPGIRRVRIFNEEGRISFSTESTEVNTAVNKRAEACYACHAQAAPLEKLDRPDRYRIFKADDKRVLGIIRPIENQTTCSSASCHAHPEGRRILGVIDVHLWLDNVDRQLADSRNHLVAFTVLAAALAAGLCVVFIVMVVHRPVKELIAGTHKVAGGDLAHRLPVRSRDELGELAASFNQMTIDLERARAEITAWTRSLEERVQKKTRELERAQTNLIASEKMASLGKLAAVVAHEVNNPLFGILTYARLVLKVLEQTPLDPALRNDLTEQLRIIERESHRCGEIIKNLLTFARQSAPRKEPQDINVLAERALTLMRHQFELQEIAVEKELGRDLPACCCDGHQIQQTILALLVNAAEAMPHGGRLRIQTAADPAGETVQVRIQDTGPGIAPEALPQIFEPFFTTKEDQHRTGLGLTVARNVALQHGGTLTARSEPGQGAEFILALPAGAAAAVPAGGNGEPA